VLLATGIVDLHPKLEQLDKAIGEGAIRYCPVCDGFEALDRRIAVLGDGQDASSKFLRTYSRDVTWLWQTEKPRAQPVLDDGFAIEGPVDGLKSMAMVFEPRSASEFSLLTEVSSVKRN
jgi:thioredoxin reductase